MFSLFFSLTSSPATQASTPNSPVAAQPSQSLLNRVPYHPAPWIASHITQLPSHKINLGRLPTPSHPIIIPGLEESGLICTIKRDDLSSFDMSGNKVRKLEFLLSDYAEYDSVITIGGIQSNHARSTAVASRQLGLDPFLILRAPDTVEHVQQSIVGNLLLDRMMGADIRLVSPGTYARIGSAGLTDQLCKQLRSQGRKPLVIPVGGSNALGAFGYLEAVEEIRRQYCCEGEEKSFPFEHIIFACGSGGTAAGLTLGCKLSGISASCHLHAVGVCDSPRYFYDHIDHVAHELGVQDAVGPAEGLCTVYQGQGMGYAKSTTEELQFLTTFSRKTGVVLDPVYSGKAMYQFVNHIVPNNPSVFKKGHRELFLHTGGTLGLYAKEADLLPCLNEGENVVKMTVTLPET